MSQSVADMDGSTQQNSALAEQSASSAAELMDEIASLRELVAFFQTGSAGMSRPAETAWQRPAKPAEAMRPAAARRAEPARTDGTAVERIRGPQTRRWRRQGRAMVGVLS